MSIKPGISVADFEIDDRVARAGRRRSRPRCETMRSPSTVTVTEVRAVSARPSIKRPA